MTVKKERTGRRRPTAAFAFRPFFFAMASFTSYTTTRGKPSFPHAGNSRNFERNSSINNDHVNRLYNWQQRMEQKKKMLKQKFVKKIHPHLLPPNILEKLAQALLGNLSELTHLPKAARCRNIGNDSAGQGEKERKTSSPHTRKKMDWENYKTKSASTKLPNATIKAKKCPLHKKYVQSKQLQQYVQDQNVCTARTIPSISPTQSSLSKQAAASITSAMGDVKKKRVPVGAVPIVKQNSPTSAGYKNVGGDGYGSYFMQHQLQKMEHEQVEAYQQAAIPVPIHGGEGFSGANAFSDRQTGSNELEKGFIGSRETISSTHALAHTYSETIPQYDRQLSPEFKCRKNTMIINQ